MYKSQAARQRALKGFRAGNCRVLVATDIAARGIDIDGVTHVINFELPNEPEVTFTGSGGQPSRCRTRHRVLRSVGTQISPGYRKAFENVANSGRRWAEGEAASKRQAGAAEKVAVAKAAVTAMATNPQTPTANPAAAAASGVAETLKRQPSAF